MSSRGTRAILRLFLLPTATLCLLNAAENPSFNKDVQPVLVQVCNTCHNPQLNSGNLNITPYFQPSTLTTNRDGWAKILAKLKAGEMPPPGIPGPTPEAMARLISFVQGEIAKGDQSRKPDPGRTIAHRLNRNEYANTIRDLLGVDFRATEEFPADDSGYGFDNIGDVLTVSPTLMQKYLSAAEQIASRAVGGDPLPKPGYVNRHDRVRKVGDSTIELKDAVDYDAEYAIKVNLTGHRGPADKPVLLRISVDGKPIKEVEVSVQISAVNKQGGATQRGVAEGRVFLTAREHTFRAEFVNDEFVKPLSAAARANNTPISTPSPSKLAALTRPPQRRRRPGKFSSAIPIPVPSALIAFSRPSRTTRIADRPQRPKSPHSSPLSIRRRRPVTPRSRACNSPSPKR